MKLFTLIFLSLFLNKSCDSQTKNDLKTAAIEYTASSRGFYQKITIQDQMVSISKDRNSNVKPIATKISDDDWKELSGYFEAIALNNLASLKAPTEKRFHDGAAIANLEIMYNDKSYKTNSFDHGYPPEAIKKIIAKINSFAKKE